MWTQADADGRQINCSHSGLEVCPDCAGWRRPAYAQTQQYRPLNVRDEMPMVYTCLGCGAVVEGMARHDEWHRHVDGKRG
jgi:hypothetical protein